MSESKGHSFQMVIVPEIICYEPGNLRPLAAFSQSTPHATIHLGAFGQNKVVFPFDRKRSQWHSHFSFKKLSRTGTIP